MRLHRILLPVAFLAITAQASELPDLGDAARASVSLNQEEQIGRQIMLQMRSEKDFLDDPVITDYLNAIGDRLVAASPSPYRKIGFFVVDDPTINAFALPGGHIGVNTGLILVARNESELAGVLGHEIGHEVQNHIARSVLGEKTSMAAALAGLAVAILASHSDNPQIAAAAITSGQALAMQNQLTETQHYEKEADRIGLKTMAGAGFDPRGMVDFFKHLMAQDRLNDSNVPGFLQSHPMTYERMADLEGRVAQMHYKPHVDSPEFALVRARVRAMTDDPKDAYQYFSARAGKHDDAAVYYGLALSALRANDNAHAIEAVEHLESLQKSSMVAELAAHVLVGTGHLNQAVASMRASIARYPDYRPLVYDYAQALLRQGKAADALAFVSDRLQLWPDDYVLYQLQAQCDHQLGRHAEEHLAQAEAYIRLDQPSLAIEQLQLARQSGDGDFYTQSVVDAKLRDLRQQLASDKGSQDSK